MVASNIFASRLAKAYNGKKIFLTGHTGFKGSWLLCMLQMLGAEVKGYSLPPDTEDALFTHIMGDQLCSSVIADVRDTKKLTEEIENFEPDFIFHLAAQPLVRKSYEIPVETFEINAIGTANLLQAARELRKACSIVVITTDKVYENKEWIYPYRETDPLGGFDPYSASKACTEIIVNSYRQSFFSGKTTNIGLASARAGNVIGGGDRAKDRIIPDIIYALENGMIPTVRNPSAIRPWQHVVEPLTGYLMLGESLAADPASFSTAFNFGPSLKDTLKVSELVEQVIKSWGSGTYRLEGETNQPHEAGILKLDISKAIEHLNWQPHLSCREAVEYTVNWYKSYRNQKAITITQSQIEHYWSLIK